MIKVAGIVYCHVKRNGRWHIEGTTGNSEQLFDIGWDYEFHVDPSGRTTEELSGHFMETFKDLYRFPLNQYFLKPFNGLKPLVYLWNAGLLKFSSKKVDQFGILKRLKSFMEQYGLTDVLRTRFLLRVDDYPRFDIRIDGFMDFHDICMEYGIDYLIGVTPYLTSDPFKPSISIPEPLRDEEIDTLLAMKKDNVEFGLHGITHRTMYQRYHTESVGLSGKKLRGSVVDAKRYLKGIGLEVETYIPPFNTFDMNNYNSIKDIFRSITGGPEAIPAMGIKHSPSRIGGSLYIPVYHPFYDKCKNMADILKDIDPIMGARIVPLTVHWSWEKGSKFEAFRELCDSISGKTTKWSNIHS